jgi:hypothetical protein
MKQLGGVAVALASVVHLSAAPQDAAVPSAVNADDLPRSYTCSNIVGTSMYAPEWKAEPDGTSDQQVVLRYRGDFKVAEAEWSMNGSSYHKATGLGVGMSGGFSIGVFGQEFTEMYVYNAGTSDLLFTSVRSGSALLPNAMKAFRGACKPTGAN